MQAALCRPLQELPLNRADVREGSLWGSWTIKVRTALERGSSS